MIEQRTPTSSPSAVGTVGVIGLGAIGGHVARALSKAGWDTIGHDIREQAFAEFPEARRADTVVELAQACDPVLIAVYDDEQLRDVLAGPVGILSAQSPPRSVCVLSTVTLDTLRWAHDQAAQRGVELIDCGVTGGSSLRRGEKIVVLAGGSDAALEAVRPALEAFGDPLLHMGALGTGMQAKLARNLMHYSAWYAAWEAARIATACGIDVDKLVLAHTTSNARSSGGGTSLLSRGIRPGPVDPDTIPERKGSANFARKDLGYVLELAGELGIPLPGAQLVRDRIDLVVGLAEDDAPTPPTIPGASSNGGVDRTAVDSIRSGIENTLYRYAWCYDMDELDGIAECFSTDAEVEFRDSGLKLGRAAVAAEMSRRRGKYDDGGIPWHVISNIYITDAPNGHKRARSWYTFFVQGVDGVQRFASVGWYDDEFRLEDGVWRVHRRRILSPQDR
jgi:3-hydroxyisobutyrate dehydrogenase-like beta-hydroxyacid dehydrogenase